MKTLAIISQKGGSGKTTLAVHMAYCASMHDQKVAIIDLDPQGSAFDWNESRKPDREFDATKADARELAGKLKDAERAGIDLAIIDTAPHVTADAALAAQLADFVLVPCRPARFDLRAVASTLLMLTAAKTPHAVVINVAPHGFRLVEEARAALAKSGVVTVLPDVVHQYAALSHAVIDGSSVHEYDPDGPAAVEIEQLYNHVTRLCGEPAQATRRRETAAA
jgi:chromosome partitioning protein